jgi:hypothetical protein
LTDEFCRYILQETTLQAIVPICRNQLIIKTMKPVSFYLRGWSYWTPDQSSEKPEAVPALLRRRVSALGRQALSLAWGLPEAANARLILSSRHGEFDRTLSLLEAAADQSSLSPADFTMSVHNALIGLLSIAHGNRGGHIAIAAGHESFCFGLLEAIACLKEKPEEPIVLIHFDEALPGAFAKFNESESQPIALALALSATGDGQPIQMQFEEWQQEVKSITSPAHDFLNFLVDNAAEATSINANRKWRWTRNV